MRASEDLAHIDTLNQIRNPLQRDKPISAQVLQRLKIITKADVLDDPSWSQALIVVTSNKERHRINDQRLTELVRQINCSRIVWYRPIFGIVKKNSIATRQTTFMPTTSILKVYSS